MVKEKKEIKTEKENKVKEKHAKKANIKEKKAKEKPITTFKSEFSKIKWPDKKEMIKYSVATIVFVIFFGIFFYAIELVISLLKSFV